MQVYVGYHTYVCANTTHPQYSSFPFLGNISGTLVAFNATMYMANISQAAPVGTVILSVGLTMSWTAASETYSVSTRMGVSQQTEPYKIQYSGQNKGRLYVNAMISRRQVVDVPYRSVVRCDFQGTSAAITADLEVQVVKTLGEYVVSVARATLVHTLFLSRTVPKMNVASLLCGTFIEHSGGRGGAYTYIHTLLL